MDAVEAVIGPALVIRDHNGNKNGSCHGKDGKNESYNKVPVKYSDNQNHNDRID